MSVKETDPPKAPDYGEEAKSAVTPIVTVTWGNREQKRQESAGV